MNERCPRCDDYTVCGHTYHKLISESEAQALVAAALGKAAQVAEGFRGAVSPIGPLHSAGIADASKWIAERIRELIPEPAQKALVEVRHLAKQERDRDWVMAFCELDIAIGVSDADVKTGLVKALAEHDAALLLVAQQEIGEVVNVDEIPSLVEAIKKLKNYYEERLAKLEAENAELREALEHGLALAAGSGSLYRCAPGSFEMRHVHPGEWDQFVEKARDLLAKHGGTKCTL